MDGRETFSRMITWPDDEGGGGGGGGGGGNAS